MQSQMGQPVSRDQLQPGDLVFFYSPVSHVGIYIGNGQMVHAPTSGDVVKVAPLDGRLQRRPAPRRLIRPRSTGSTRCSSPHTNAARTPPGRCTSQRVTTPGSTLAAPGQADDVVQHVLPHAQVRRRSPAAPGSPGARTRCSFSTEPPGPLSTSQ